MKIGISARGLSYPVGGVKEYIRNLVESLVRIDEENEYFIYYSHADQVLEVARNNVHEIVLPKAPLLLWDHVILPWHLKKDKVDVCLYPKCVIPLIPPCRSVVTVYDMAYFMPELRAYKLFDTLYMKAMIPRSIRRANSTLTISNYSKMDICRFVSRAEADRIRVTYLASSFPLSDLAEGARKKYQIGTGPYIFFSGSLSPRKNLTRCLAAFASIKDTITHTVVITGSKRWGNCDIERLIGELGIENRVRLIGFVHQSDLPSLYSQADMYVMPSLYEGFSLTVVEAMQQGCPVVLSNVSCHPEVAGDAARYFDPYSEESIANAILEVASNVDLRSALQAKGRVQAAKYSWEKCARETLAVFNQVVETK